MTLFFVMGNGIVVRKEVNRDQPLYGHAGLMLATQAIQIIEMTPYGCGKTIKNRNNRKPQYFTRQQMTMLSLQAES